MACLSVENGGALVTRICGLVNSLEVFGDVATKLELEAAFEGDHTGPSFLRLVAGTLKEMVGKLVLDIKAKPEIQKLLLVNKKSVSSATNDRAFLQDATLTKHPASQIGTLSSNALCISGINARSVKRAGVGGAVTCKHFCEHHPEVIDPVLWRTLPEEVVELVFGKLPMAKITDLYSASRAWCTILKSSKIFKRVAAKRHPKLFGLVGWDRDGDIFNVMYDIELKRSSEMAAAFGGSLRVKDENGYDDSMFACDGGLVCFVPRKNFLVRPILIGNPLTCDWKFLPRLALENKEPFLVQLVMEEDTKCYTVSLVCRDKVGGALAAHCFDSRTSDWSKMESGLVYGGSHNLVRYRLDAPCVFDCTIKTLFTLRYCSALRGVSVGQFSMVKDRVFVLHKGNGRRHGADAYRVLEYTWDSTTLDLKRLSEIDSTLPTGLPRNYAVHLFSSRGFVLLFGGNREKGEYQSQLSKLYDSSMKEWHSLAWAENDRLTVSELDSVYMCELQWDAVP